jgi:hypothetical protein
LLKKEGFQVSSSEENQNAVAKIFGQDVAFEIVEKYRQLGMKETKSDYGYLSRSMQSSFKLAERAALPIYRRLVWHWGVP